MYLYSLGHFLHIRWHNDRCKILLCWYTRRWGHTRLFQSSHTRRYLQSSRKNIQIIIKYYDSFLWNLAFLANGKALKMWVEILQATFARQLWELQGNGLGFQKYGIQCDTDIRNRSQHPVVSNLESIYTVDDFTTTKSLNLINYLYSFVPRLDIL